MLLPVLLTLAVFGLARLFVGVPVVGTSLGLGGFVYHRASLHCIRVVYSLGPLSLPSERPACSKPRSADLLPIRPGNVYLDHGVEVGAAGMAFGPCPWHWVSVVMLAHVLGMA